MPQEIINLLKGDSKGTETDYRDAMPVNMVAVLRPIFNAAGYMLQHPGLTQYATGLGIDRGGIWNERLREHLRISGTNLISVQPDGTVATLGTVSGLETASLPYSFNTQAVITDGKMWLYDKGLGFREVTDPDLGDPIDGVWVNGYYFLTDGSFLYHTDLTDESAIDPLKFATSEFSPDPTLGVAKTNDNKVIVFNRYTTEFFVDTASENFAFTRIQTRALKTGIVGTHCKAEVDGSFFIMGGRKDEDVSIHVLGVGTSTKIGSREVDKIINSYTEEVLAKSVLEARTEDDYPFLIVHLPNETLLFNTKVAKQAGTEQAWTILKTDIVGNLPWRAKHGVFEPRLGQWVYGDKRDGTIGILDDTVATHYNDIAEWELKTPFMYLDSSSIDELEIETIPGYTSTSDATVSISLTYDGVSYSKEWFEMYGLPSAYSKRFIIHRLGYVANWVGIKLRGATRSRMAFSRAFLTYG